MTRIGYDFCYPFFRLKEKMEQQFALSLCYFLFDAYVSMCKGWRVGLGMARHGFKSPLSYKPPGPPEGTHSLSLNSEDCGEVKKRWSTELGKELLLANLIAELAWTE